MDHGGNPHHEHPATPAPPLTDGAVLEYLRSLRHIVDAQREVMLSYLRDQRSARPLPAGEVRTNGATSLNASSWRPRPEPVRRAFPTPTGRHSQDGAGRIPAPVAPMEDALLTRRFVVEDATLAPALPVASLAGQSVALMSDPWDGLAELQRRLEQAGGQVEVIPTHRGAPRRPLPEPVAERLGRVDVMVHLGAADPDAPVDARDVFAALRPAIAGQATTLVAVAGHGRGAAALGSGVPGLMRAVAREQPDHHVRVVEISRGQSADVLACLLADEVLDPAGPPAIAYRDGVRTTRRVTKGTPVPTEVPALPLNQASVVVVTGGARGISSRIAMGLAEATGCRLELLGRTRVSRHEDPRTAGAADRASLRQLLVGMAELRSPAEIEATCDRLLAAREVRRTMSALAELGSPANYWSVDVRDSHALIRTLDEIRAHHGRIDAVIHGASVIEDDPSGAKSDESFDRVFATKVDSARTLLGHLGTDTRLVVLFGSVSGVFGNWGQVDYSAANDALDDLGNHLDGADGRRVISVDWGPWAGTGPVSSELEQEHIRRGVGLVDPVEGVKALLNEMTTLPGEPAQVVIMRAEPEALDCRPPTAPGTFAASTLESQDLE
jgi:NAD(P)-dependent dehydrogenase (short-subunit alcohol dehydrogenase family)